MGEIVAESRFRTLLLSPGIFAVLLSLCVSQAFGYGKTHSYIAERAAEVWPADNSHEIRKYLMPGAGDMDGDGTSKLENLLKHDRPKNDSPWTQYIGNTIVEGVVEEDAGVRSWRLPIVIPKYGGESLKEWVDHFWNPDDNTTWSSRSLFGIDCDVSSYSMNAYEKGALWFAAAYVSYEEGEKAKAFYYLGRVAHCLQDMAVPAHVLGDLHRPIVDPDFYEKWAKDYSLFSFDWSKAWNTWDLSSDSNDISILRSDIRSNNNDELKTDFSTLYLDNAALFNRILKTLNASARVRCVAGESEAIESIEHLKDIVENIQNKIAAGEIDNEYLDQALFKLEVLFYNLAQASQHFPSDDRQGNDENIPPFAAYWPKVNQNLLFMDSNKKKIGSYLLPAAVQFTATLYQLFWDTTHPPMNASALDVTITSLDSSDFPRIALYTTVEDADGQAILDLDSYDFKVFQDQTPESPISVSSAGASFADMSVCVVMDTSGSMDRAIGRARDAAISFSNKLKPRDRSALIAFTENVYIVQPFTDDKDAMTSAISGLYADGYTALYDAVYKGIEITATQPGIKAVIALTDGQDNKSARDAKEVEIYSNSMSIPIYIVGLVGSDDGVNERVLRRMADVTGGRYYEAPGADDLQELYESISERLENLYEVSYITYNKSHDGSKRFVTVQATSSGDTGYGTLSYTAPGTEGAISGVILNDKTHEPIKSASVLIEHETAYSVITDASVSTDENGTYTVGDLSPGHTYTVTASAVNYHKARYKNPVPVEAFETVNDVDFRLRQVDAHLAAKRALIAELRDKEQMYVEEESRAEEFLNIIERKGASATTQEEEAVQRLYLSESVASEAYTDAKRMAQLGTDGLGGFVDVAMAVISVCGGMGEVLKEAPLVGEDLSSAYVAAKSEMVNYIALKSNMFQSAGGGAISEEAIGQAYDKIFIKAAEEFTRGNFSDAMADVHEYIEKNFFLEIYELATADLIDQSVEWAASSAPVFGVGRSAEARNRVEQHLYDMNVANEEMIRKAEIVIGTGDTIKDAGTLASGIMLAGGIAIGLATSETVVGAGLRAALASLSEDISIATNTVAGGMKLSASAEMAAYLWSTLPGYMKDGTAYSFDVSPSALPAPQRPITQADGDKSYASAKLLAPGMAQAGSTMLIPEYSTGSYNSILNEVYGYIQNDEPERAQESLTSLIESGNILMGNINVSAAQILVASPRAMYEIADYNAIYSRFENDLSSAALERMNLYTLFALYLIQPVDTAIRELVTMQIGKTTDANSELSETLTSTTEALNEAMITIPTLVIVKSFSTPNVMPQDDPFVISAIIKNIGQYGATDVSVELSAARNSGLAMIERNAIYMPHLDAGEEREVSWELEHVGRSSPRENEMSLVAISVDSTSDAPDFTSLPNTYVFIPAPPPTPPTGGELSSVNIYAYPNPVNPEIGPAKIRYSLSRDRDVTVEVYDASGELVTTLIEAEHRMRLVEYSESWDGRNDMGDMVANGVYFYVITTEGDEKAAGKIAVLR